MYMALAINEVKPDSKLKVNDVIIFLTKDLYALQLIPFFCLSLCPDPLADKTATCVAPCNKLMTREAPELLCADLVIGRIVSTA